MRLYYYTSKQWGMKSLWEKRLKIAQYADLNDPFELLPFQQQDKDARTHIRMVQGVLGEVPEQLAQRFRGVQAMTINKFIYLLEALFPTDREGVRDSHITGR